MKLKIKAAAAPSTKLLEVRPSKGGVLRIDPSALRKMQEMGGEHYAWQCHNEQSSNYGHICFILVSARTLPFPPPMLHPKEKDYYLVGKVNFKTGVIDTEIPLR